MEGETKGHMKQRHYKEKKALEKEIMDMKRKCPKKDKTKQEELKKEIARMESELAERQAKEIESAGERERAAAEAAEAAEAEEYRLRDEQQRQRARERSEKQRQREQQRRNELEQQEALFSRLGNRGEAETNKLRARLREEGRDISVVPSDGNCLFSALSRALDEKGISVTPQALRLHACEHLCAHADTYAPFLDVSPAVHAVRVSSPGVWGSHVELHALSEYYQVPIYIYKPDGNDIIINETFKGEPLRIAYQPNAFASGEHYDAVKPLDPQQTSWADVE